MNNRIQTKWAQSSYIFVNFDFEALHRYPDAPEEVEYLKNPHRHIFKVRVDIEVHHDDREIEFIMFKHFLQGLPKAYDLDFMSCEMLCDFFHEKICEEYDLNNVRDINTPPRRVTIEVSEDGENGAVKTYYPNNIVVVRNVDFEGRN